MQLTGFKIRYIQSVWLRKSWLPWNFGNGFRFLIITVNRYRYRWLLKMVTENRYRLRKNRTFFTIFYDYRGLKVPIPIR